ncbi:UvrD-helicase domain-containing protein [Halalkalibacter nanhaiisediminis]|uniref:DNA 3'-5' helicase n=1 Tax=Halalkalibacter nanhaiisediminis TaxID=688079 RepID=A0A562QKA5_9BACI|nr:UvrD-helicase domain-containing protein [Halalkalibacter nanhaiisediminis]TWI57135.1 ATP-dependent exoDNAse (exonuclease V) beta subunit [Halalkalibacter nanhaiisediminis]
MQFNDAQRQAITSVQPLVLVSAGAGSGKTRILTERFVHLCELRLEDKDNAAGATVDEMVAITFTEKAAREMKDRIRKRLAEKEAEASEERARAFWQEQKEAVERAHISTFHSFCQRLLSQHAMAANLPPKTRVLDDMEARRAKRTIMKSLLEERHFLERATPLLEVMSKQQLMESIEQIHDDIREFVIGEEAISYLHVTDMLKTQSAAKKQKQLESVQVFHQQALRCVAAFPPSDELTKAQQNHVDRIKDAFSTLSEPSEPESYITFLNEIMPSRSDKKWNEKAPALYELYVDYWKPLKDSWKDIGGDISIDEQITVYVQSIVDLLQEFAVRYAREKEQVGALDFTDLQQKAVALLTNPMIKEACQRQFRHMMVDEFQDTNRLQLAMLERIEPMFQFIVGDQKQSIYRFRGANVALMNEREDIAVKEEWAEAILMNTNYRTSAPIIEAVNKLFAHAMTSVRTKAYETVYTPLTAGRNGERENEKRVELTVLPKDEERETNTYQALANRMSEMIQLGLPHVQKGDVWVRPTWGDIAILIPARSHLLTLEKALNNLGIPYVVSGGIGFYQRQEIIDFVTLLRWLNRPFEDVHLLAILRSPLCGLTVADFLAMKEGLDETEAFYQLMYEEEHSSFDRLPSAIKEASQLVKGWLERWTPFRFHQSLKDILMELFSDTGLRSSLLLQTNGLQKVRNVEKLIEVIVSSNHMELETILAELDERMLLSEKEGESEVERIDGDVVQIMTVHASKGLEFPIVCLPHLDRNIRGDKGRIRFHPELGIVFNLEKEGEELDDKLIPYQTPGYSIVKDLADAEAREESKRLFYVAMTRARDYLYMIGEESNAYDTWLKLVETAMEETELESKVIKSEESQAQSRFEKVSESYSLPKRVQKQEMPLSLSVSEVLTFIKDPLEYFNRFVVGLPFAESKEDLDHTLKEKSIVDPSRLGTLVHRACELRDYGLSIEGAITAALSEEEEIIDSATYEIEMSRLMGNYTDEQREQLGNVIANEWSFIVNIEGVELIGEIDKVVVKNGKLAIIDFKTNKIKSSGEELLEFYRPQLYLYKMAYEEQTGEKIDSTSLYVLRDAIQPLHTVVVKQGEEDAVRVAIQTIKSLRISRARKEAYQALKKQHG